MPICRMDLADAGSPDKLVTLILQAEPNFPLPVPIEELCQQLDISSIENMEFEGFEGGLLTDDDRSSGIILLRRGFEARRRFTIAHELGHFLMPKHVPDVPGRFLCKGEDLFHLSPKEGSRRQRMEAEANRFASFILMPPPMLRQAMQGFHEPDLQHIPMLARQFNVSKEAMARAYSQHHAEPVAIIVTRFGKILRSYKNISFPYISYNIGDPIPSGSNYYKISQELGVASDFAECVSDRWIEVRRGERAPMLYEQIYPQRDGYGLLLLLLERVDEEDEAEERDLEESWHVGFRSRGHS